MKKLFYLLLLVSCYSVPSSRKVLEKGEYSLNAAGLINIYPDLKNATWGSKEDSIKFDTSKNSYLTSIATSSYIEFGYGYQYASYLIRLYPGSLGNSIIGIGAELVANLYNNNNIRVNLSILLDEFIAFNVKRAYGDTIAVASVDVGAATTVVYDTNIFSPFASVQATILGFYSSLGSEIHLTKGWDLVMCANYMRIWKDGLNIRNQVRGLPSKNVFTFGIGMDLSLSKLFDWI